MMRSMRGRKGGYNSDPIDQRDWTSTDFWWQNCKKPCSPW